MDLLTIAVEAACLVARPAPKYLAGHDYQVIEVEFTAFAPYQRRRQGSILDGLELRVWEYKGSTTLPLEDLVCVDHQIIDCSVCWPGWLDGIDLGDDVEG